MSTPPESPGQVAVVMPDLGVASALLSVWFAEPGDRVYEGDRLVEVAISGATFDVSCPATGRLGERLAMPSDRVQTGQVLGTVIADSADRTEN